MNRVIYITDEIGNKRKYVLIQEYRQCSIYQEKSNCGYKVSQSYAITYGRTSVNQNDTHILICPSYNNLCLEELLDAIDKFRRCGRYNFRTFQNGKYYTIHPNGKCLI